MSKERYTAAGHRVQTAIAALMGDDPNLPLIQPKHLRVGIDMSKSDMGGLAGLLIEKGVFTEAEYIEAITKAAEREADDYEQEVRETLGNPNIKVV